MSSTRWAVSSSCPETTTSTEHCKSFYMPNSEPKRFLTNNLNSESCEADVAYPPGWYPTATVNGTPVFSTFAQRYTGTLSGGSVYTVGDLTTPTAPYSTPSSSNCVTTSTIANGIALSGNTVPGSGSQTTGGTSKPTAGTPTGTAGASNGGSTGTSASSKLQRDGGLEIIMVTFWAVVAGMGAVVVFA